MKKKLLPLLLALSMLLSVSVSALGADDFQQGKLSGVTALSNGALLVTDTYNKVIWRVDGDQVTRFAGVIGVAGLSGEPTGVYHDSVLDKAYFMEPWDIVPFLDGYAVSDASANVVRYIEGGRVYTLAGTGKAGSADGAGEKATFSHPTGLAVDKDGLLYVADTNSGSIRRIDQTGKVTTLAKGLLEPTGLCWSSGSLYVAETGRNRICRIVGSQAVPYAGVAVAAEDADEYYGGFVDGPVSSARFDHPQGIAVGTDGTLYVADTGNSAVRAIRSGRVDTLARASSNALMPESPRGLALLNGTLYAADRFAGSVLTISVANKTYADVANNAWFAAVVAMAGERGIAGGVAQDLFEPDAPLSRAMFVTMLSRIRQIADGTVVIDGDATFSDVPDGDWYAKAVRWAADNGIAQGDSGNYAPARAISREECAAMLYRYAQMAGLDVSASGNALQAFEDAGDAAEWAQSALRWACAKGILNGSDGLLQPKATTSRAQALMILSNFLSAYSL